MNVQSYDELLGSKHRLSLMLFLLLNTATAIFCVLRVIHHDTLTVTTPTIAIIIISIILLTWMLLKPVAIFPLLNIAAALSGLLWAWHITLRYQQELHLESGYLLVALVSVFFISAIALGDYLLPFLLHTAPGSVVVLALDRGQSTLIILFIIILPLMGFSLHHLMLRKRDKFTRRLVRQLYEEKETYSDLSMLDPLTGLYNRRGLQNRLENVIDNHTGNHYVLLLDIDNFKSYNDNYGHAMGDQALTRVSVAIRDAVRSRDIVTRYGGEEFLVILTNVNEAIALKQAERVRQFVLDLEIPHRFNDKVATHVTISVGVAPLIANDFDKALAHADRALYLAKSQGRNTVFSLHDASKRAPGKPADIV
ncbi:GGDEF domain-containing protein [Erwinia tasmaniensis]|uniref:diguanylate cyclase n=1 Tax=Erwinia tasmaniensis (strain DSM 17950 / CFBP 7177 / CIP 109463 / NCPPB 4357 / Et1/99) TaxID=465817 RepID=B2VH93_ERWT9|nr:GGDEF domain-containing protein [Erwinia tasmaniensis]CAO95650.1 HmsT (Hemin storage system protein) [Erwinia tasmaniensis Et1/99]